SLRRRKMAAIRTKSSENNSGGNNGWKRKHHLMAVAGLSFLSLVYYLFLWSPDSQYDFGSLSTKEKAELRRLEPHLMYNLTLNSPYPIGRFCDSGNDCFTVVQRFHGSGDDFKAQRFIMFEQNPGMGLTIANLIRPEIITPHHLVPMNWRIDAGIVFSYNLIQIVAGFMKEGLSFNRSEPQRVLQIGMGGGSATTFMAKIPLNLEFDVVELEPNVYEAAKKWFEFPVNSKVRVHIMDGIDFVRRAAEQGIVYDSLLLDACSNSPNASIVCPHEVFLQENVMADMSKVVGSTGVFSANMYMPKNQENLQNEVTRRFSAHFKSCSALKIAQNGQRCLICSNRENWNWEHGREQMLSNLIRFDYEMGTKTALFLDRMNPVDQ
ncbi:hypothetical protein PFISCL1PPCAC_26178, partial [Pristionchus fissidentatus]